MSNKFNFFVGIDLLKSKEADVDDESKYDNMIFEGVASDDSVDDEGESMNPEGFDLKRFLKSGLFNLDHLTTRSPVNKSRFWIGEPIDAWIKDNKLFVKGKLWKHSPEARAFWDKCLQMEKSGSSRKGGMSIEGKVLERDKKNPKKVVKALITNIALTFQPVNTNSWVSLLKGKQDQDYIEYGESTEPKILLETENEDGSLTVIDVDFNVTLKSKNDIRREILLNKFKNGDISEKLYENAIKNLI